MRVFMPVRANRTDAGIPDIYHVSMAARLSSQALGRQQATGHRPCNHPNSVRGRFGVKVWARRRDCRRPSLSRITVYAVR